MKFAKFGAIGSLVGIATSYASLRYGEITALGPLGFGGWLIWYAHRHHPEDWNRD